VKIIGNIRGTMKRHLFVLLAVAGLAPAFSVSAHHSASEFDPKLSVNIEGAITRVEWKSPHARLYVDVVENGKTVNYNFELPSPNTLMRRGWKNNALKPGDHVSVTGMRARNFPYIAIASSVLDKDGKAMFSGTADPANN
jgi:hypothetical protein